MTPDPADAAAGGAVPPGEPSPGPAPEELAADGPAPAWLTELAAGVGQMVVPPRLRAPDTGGRASAVLLLFGETAGVPDLLIVQRGQHLRRHAGQPAFPGGAIEPSDHGPVDAALREAAEEVGVDPAGVEVLAVLPELYIPRSGFRVTPVLAGGRRPRPLVAAAAGEIVSAARARLTDGGGNQRAGPTPPGQHRRDPKAAARDVKLGQDREDLDSGRVHAHLLGRLAQRGAYRPVI